MTIHSGTVLIYTIHRVEPWWAEVGRNMGFENSATVSDIRGDGDYCVVDDFYAAYRHRLRGEGISHFSDTEIEDIIARCRLLRWLPDQQARAMVLAMADAMVRVLEAAQPSAITAFPMDRYVSDILERLGAARGIPFYELTASAVPGMSMLMYRGQLITRSEDPEPALVERITSEIADPLFTPAYVQGAKRFTPLRWWKVFAYFRLRGWFFKLYSIWKRDRLGLHYLDAQAFLGHKPSAGDVRICAMVAEDWKTRLAKVEQEKRLFIGLQLFPEASIDYWISDSALIRHDDLLERVARQFSNAGFHIAVKDHPLQFGFRKTDLIDRLLAIPNVVLVPYEVSGNEVLDHCGVNFTCTGTLGMQAALTGKISVTTPCYYTTPEDFVLFRNLDEVETLVDRVGAASPPRDLRDRQRRIVSHLLKGSFESDFFSFQGFDPAKPKPSVAALGRAFGAFLEQLKVKTS